MLSSDVYMFSKHTILTVKALPAAPCLRSARHETEKAEASYMTLRGFGHAALALGGIEILCSSRFSVATLSPDMFRHVRKHGKFAP